MTCWGLGGCWADFAAIDLGAPSLAGWEPDTLLDRPELWPSFDGPVDMMMYLDAMTYLPDDILVKVDRAAMSVSLESRVPMLDHRVVEFASSLPLGLYARFELASTRHAASIDTTQRKLRNQQDQAAANALIAELSRIVWDEIVVEGAGP